MQVDFTPRDLAVFEKFACFSIASGRKAAARKNKQGSAHVAEDDHLKWSRWCRTIIDIRIQVHALVQIEYLSAHPSNFRR